VMDIKDHKDTPSKKAQQASHNKQVTTSKSQQASHTSTSKHTHTMMINVREQRQPREFAKVRTDSARIGTRRCLGAAARAARPSRSLGAGGGGGGGVTAAAASRVRHRCLLFVMYTILVLKDRQASKPSSKEASVRIDCQCQRLTVGVSEQKGRRWVFVGVSVG
jgi:hypothetical protein